MQHLETADDEVALHVQADARSPTVPAFLIVAGIKGRSQETQGDEGAFLSHIKKIFALKRVQ